MARITRGIAPRLPTWVTQRGYGCAQTFFCDRHYIAFKDFLRRHPIAVEKPVNGRIKPAAELSRDTFRCHKNEAENKSENSQSHKVTPFKQGRTCPGTQSR